MYTLGAYLSDLRSYFFYIGLDVCVWCLHRFSLGMKNIDPWFKGGKMIL